jgi:serine/threonine protein phosphatase 1
MNARTSNGHLARLRGARRVWAIGAIHGDAARLKNLHDRMGARLTDGDRIVYLGNYLGHGAAIVATIDELLDFRRRVLSRKNAFACDVVHLRGAQEEMWHKLLQLQFAPNPAAVLQWMVRAGIEATVAGYAGDLRQGFAATRDGPRTITRWTSALREAMNAVPGHTTLFTGLRHAAMTEPRALLFVHAAVDPARALIDQRDAFWWGGADILQLSEPFEGFARVIRGYDRSARGLVEGDYAVSLDAGAGRGGRLIAACFDMSGTVLDHVEA